MRTNDDLLLKLFNSVNNYYFDNLVVLRGIFWTSDKKLFNDHNYKVWADYCFCYKGIRINQDLKKDKAPQYVIKYLIYHECLHYFLGYVNHTVLFKIEEEYFKHYKKANNWLKNLP